MTVACERISLLAIWAYGQEGARLWLGHFLPTDETNL